MRFLLPSAAGALDLLVSATAHAQTAASPPPGEAPSPSESLDPGGDLFAAPGHVSVAAASGLPFLGIVEGAVGITRGFSVGVVGGVTPSVLTAGVRPRVRVRVGDRLAVMLVAPILYYPRASAPGPGNIGETSWVLTRPELMLDAEVGRRAHVAGGMGIIAAASTLALGSALQGKSFELPAYAGLGDPRQGFAGGIWNTVCFHTSWALSPATHLFAEGSLVLSGLVPADDLGGPPVVVTVGAQHAF